jgi:hypothetical protein
MMEPTSLIKKLQIKAGTRLWLINVPQALAEAISAGAEVEPVHAGDDYDGALAFCRSVLEVEAFSSQILERLPVDGLFWLAYRKGAAGKETGLSRDDGWAALDRAGFRPVRSIAIDDEWTAIRFRERALVKAKEGSVFG